MTYFIMGTLLLLITVVVLIDVVPIFFTWLSRIYIGRYSDIDIWSNSITSIGVKWLNKTPKIKVTDNTRLIAIDMIKGNYTKSTIQHWQEGALLLGLGEYIKNHKDENVKNEIDMYLSQKFNSDGTWRNVPHHVDGALLAYSIMKLDFMDTNKYKKAFDQILQLINDHIGLDGTVQYRKFMKGYRYIDTIGFICPFLIAYGNRYKDNKCIELAIKQIKEYEKYVFLKEQHIPCHAYKIEGKEPLGLYGWGRGLGWYAIGLIDAYKELNIDSEYKSVLEESIVRFSKSILNYQQEDGSWSWIVTRKETRKDSSTTATLAWFLLNAFDINDISRDCMLGYEKSIKYLMGVTRRSGAIDFSQGDTKDIGVYSQLFDILPFTQGFTIRCLNKEQSYNKDKVVNL